MCYFQRVIATQNCAFFAFYFIVLKKEEGWNNRVGDLHFSLGFLVRKKTA